MSTTTASTPTPLDNTSADTLTTTTPTSSPPFAIPTILKTPLTLLTTHLLPPPRRTALLTTIQSHPLVTSFLACQLLCAAVPISLFLAGLAVTASVAASVFACLAFLVLAPVLVFTCLLATWLWAVGCVLVLGGTWVFGLVDRRVAEAEVKSEESDGDAKGKGLVVEEKEVSE